MRTYRGHLVRLVLTNAIGTEARNSLYPVGRLLAVGVDYVAIDQVRLDGVAQPGLGVVQIDSSHVVAVERAAASPA